jgi:hypothetical protein
MVRRLILWALVAAIAAPAAAQQWPDAPPAQSKPKPKAKAKQAPPDDVEELTPAQIQRAQEAEPRSGSQKDMPQAVKRPSSKAVAQPRQVDCRGAFARDSSHIRLAQIFGPDNVTFTDVEGPDNSKIQASVLFPRDPARRLEMLWNNTASRSGTAVIAINGKSAWAGPRGAKLGMQLPAIEKLNGKPSAPTAAPPPTGRRAHCSTCRAAARSACASSPIRAPRRKRARNSRTPRNCCRATPTSGPCGRRWRKS